MMKVGKCKLFIRAIIRSEIQVHQLILGIDEIITYVLLINY